MKIGIILGIRIMRIGEISRREMRFGMYFLGEYGSIMLTIGSMSYEVFMNVEYTICMWYK